MTIPLPEPDCTLKNHYDPRYDTKLYNQDQMKAYGEAMRREAIEEVRSNVLAAGLANGGIETAADIYREIAWQVREKALEDIAALATVGATYPELMQYLEDELRKLK